MTIHDILALLGTGLGTGFAGGLLGVGGSFIMTPVEYAIFTGMGLSVDTAVKLSFGTSLMVILPTAASGTWRHHREKAVWWRAALIIGGVGTAAAFAGATLASYLPGETLKIIFGAAVIAAAVRMLTQRVHETDEPPVNDPRLWAVWAIPIGLVSGLIGIGGGMLAVPILVLALRFRMHDAIATSLAIVMITSIGGIAGYIYHGGTVVDLPPHSLGYIHLPTWGLLTATSAVMAPVGARTAHRIPAKKLRYVFVGILFFMGLRMLGVFD